METMNSKELQIAVRDFLNCGPHDLETMLRGTRWKLEGFQRFVRYMVLLCETYDQIIFTLHRLRIILEQNQERDFAPDLLKFVLLEIEFHSMDKIHLGSIDNRNNEPSNKPRDSKPLQWYGQANELATVFFNLNQQKLIDIGPLPLAKWINENFVDAKGKPFVVSTTQTNLREDKPDKRKSDAPLLETDSLLSPNPD